MASELGVDMAMTTAMASDHASHDAHAAVPVASDDGIKCEHCEPAAYASVAPCDVEMSSECQSDAPCNLDNRRDKFVLKDLPVDSPVSLGPGISITASEDHNLVFPGVHFLSYAPGVLPSINLLNCIYLI